MHDLAFIDFNMPVAGEMCMQLTSTDGKVLYTNKEMLIAGSYKRSLNVAGVAQGIYFLQLVYNGKRIVFKLIKR